MRICMNNTNNKNKNSKNSSNNANNTNNVNNAANKEKSRTTPRQIAAIIGIILLVGLYVVTLIAAITDNSGSGRLFQVCLIGTVAIPLLIWIYIWMYGKLTQKHTMADLDIGGTAENKENEKK